MRRQRYENWVWSDDAGALLYEPPEGRTGDTIDDSPVRRARAEIRNAARRRSRQWHRRVMDGFASNDERAQAVANRLLDIVVREGNDRARPRVIAPTQRGYELPIEGAADPRGFVDTVIHGVVDKGFLADADLGAVVCALDDRFDLETVFERGMQLYSRSDLANTALRFTIDIVRVWNGGDYTSLGLSLQEMFERVGLTSGGLVWMAHNDDAA